MKNRHISAYLIACAIFILAACKKDKTVDPEPELTTAQKLAGTYKIQSATKNGVDATADYQAFALLLEAGTDGNPSNYTLTEGIGAKPNYNSGNSGTWQLLNNNTKIDFDGTTQVDLSISDLDTSPQLKLTWTMPESLDKTEPIYILNLTKQ